MYDTDLAASFTVDVLEYGNLYASYTVRGNTFNDAITNLVSDQAYDFVVTANRAGAASSPASDVFAAAPAEMLFASGPTFTNENGIGNLTLHSSGDDGVNWTISWTDQDNMPLLFQYISGDGATEVYPEPPFGTQQMIATITAMDSTGQSFTLPAFYVSVVPEVPTGLVAATLSPNAISLSWNPTVTATSSYTILYSTDGLEYSEFDTVDGSTTTYTAQGLVPGTNYYFEVVGVNSSGNDSSPSARATAMTEPDPWDTQVGGPTLIGEGAQYNLSLSATQATSGPTFDHWMVDWGDGTAVSYYGITVTTASHTFAAGFTFGTINVTACTADIQADGSGSGGSNSLALTEQPINVDIVPIAPTGLSANVVTSTEADLTWSDNASQAANGYDILRSDGGGDFNLIDTVAAGVTSYADETIGDASSNTLQYEVQAIGDLQSIVSSPSQSQFVITTPDLPGLLVNQGTSIFGSVNLTWMYRGNDESGFVIQMADVTLGQSLSPQSTPGPVGASNQSSTTISGLNVGDTYQFEISTEYTAGGTSAASETSYVVPADSTTGPAVFLITSAISTLTPHEALKSYSMNGIWTLGAGPGVYGLYSVNVATSHLGGLNLGAAEKSRGEAVVKGGEVAVSGAVNIGLRGYGSFTNAGSAVTIGGGLTITGLGSRSTNSYFNQIAGSTTVSGAITVGNAAQLSSNVFLNNDGLLAIGGGTFTYTQPMSVFGSGSTLDLAGPISSTASLAQMSFTGSDEHGLTMGAGTTLEFDPTSYAGSVPAGSISAGYVPTLNLGTSTLADAGAHLEVNLSNYHISGIATYPLIHCDGVVGLGGENPSNFFGAAPIAASGYTTIYSFDPILHDVTVTITKNNGVPANSVLQSGTITPHDGLTYEYGTRIMFDTTEGLYRVWSTVNAIGSRGSQATGDNIGYKEYPTLQGLSSAPNSYAASPQIAAQPSKIETDPKAKAPWAAYYVSDPDVYYDPGTGSYILACSGGPINPNDKTGPYDIAQTYIGFGKSVDGGHTFTLLSQKPSSTLQFTSGTLLTGTYVANTTSKTSLGAFIMPDLGYDDYGFGVGQPSVAYNSVNHEWYMAYFDHSVGPYQIVRVIASSSPTFAGAEQVYAGNINGSPDYPPFNQFSQSNPPIYYSSPSLSFDPATGHLIIASRANYDAIVTLGDNQIEVATFAISGQALTYIGESRSFTSNDRNISGGAFSFGQGIGTLSGQDGQLLFGTSELLFIGSTIDNTLRAQALLDIAGGDLKDAPNYALSTISYVEVLTS